MADNNYVHSRNMAPKGCCCDPEGEEWIGPTRRAVCDSPLFDEAQERNPKPTDICGRCEHDRICHEEEEESESPVLVTGNTILSSSELMAQTFNSFNQIFGAKQ